MQRIIFHVDVNSAFLSWEAAKRVREGEQDIRLIPAAIGGDRDKRTGDLEVMIWLMNFCLFSTVCQRYASKVPSVT